MNTFRKSLLKILFIPFLFLSSTCFSKNEWKCTSPDSKLQVTLFLSKKNQLFYKATINDSTEGTVAVVENSRLGIVRDDQSFIEGLKFVNLKTAENQTDKYILKRGKRSSCENTYNQTEFTFKNSKGAQLKVLFRLHNDGLAFKYIFPEIDSTVHSVKYELTEFAFPVEGRAWMHPYADASKWGPAYERNFENAIPIGTTSRDSIGWAFPLLFNTNGYWLLTSEAGLDRSYCGSHLEAKARNGIYKIRFPEANEANEFGDQFPTWKLPWEMPWRFIVISKSVGGIIESTRVTDLSFPSKVKNETWIKPGKSAWSWVTDRPSTRDFNKQISYIDFASQMNWQYSLIDGGWPYLKGGTIEQLCEYAKSKNIGLWIWYESGGSHNSGTEKSRNLLFDAKNRVLEFAKLQQLGIKGVKIDFFHSDKQWMMNYYLDILKDAADHQLMVNFHGCTIPRGWSRTYPNLMSMEAVRGVECYTWDPRFPAEAALYNNILAFTRNVVGPMDYTPVTFGAMEYPHVTTFGHELALSVIFESGIMHFGDRKESYLSLPSKVIDFLKDVPNAWDETRWVDGTPDTYLILARRKGTIWYIAGINTSLKKEISFNLPFIDKGKKIEIISDGENGKNFKFQEIEFNGNPVKIFFLVNGGFVGRIK